MIKQQELRNKGKQLTRGIQVRKQILEGLCSRATAHLVSPVFLKAVYRMTESARMDLLIILDYQTIQQLLNL